MPSRRATSERQEKLLLEKGVRSGLEDTVADYMEAQGVSFDYEEHKIPWLPPQRVRSYIADFVLKNGIIIETKGRFTTEDRQKMIQVRKQHPDLDIRFVFSNSRTTLVTQKTREFQAWARNMGIKVPRSGPGRDVLKKQFFEHLRAAGKRVPSQTTYGDWAQKHGFPYADTLPPLEWLSEPPNRASIRALKELMK